MGFAIQMAPPQNRQFGDPVTPGAPGIAILAILAIWGSPTAQGRWRR